MTGSFLKHPVATWMLFTAFVVTGIYALPKLQIEAIPDVDLPSLTISTQWNGASPKSIQRSITLPIEEAVRNVHGVEEVKSTSRPGRSNVEVEFKRGTDLDFARLELNEQLSAVRRELPLNAGEPQVFSFVPEEFDTEDFFTFSIESELPPNELRDQAERWILPQILAVEGIADARVQGGARPLVKIILDRKKLELYGITADEVFGSLDQLDELTGAGVMRAEGLEKLLALRDPIDVNRLATSVIARRGGRTYSLSMLGRVEESFEDPDFFVRANGNNVVQVAADKRSGANTISVSGNLRDALPEIEAGLPFAASFHVDSDQGDDLREKLVELIYRSLAILAVLFVLLAISLRQIRLTAVVITSILFSIVISLSLFYFFKISVNFITISGLTVCFGMILDNSILVLDSIHRRIKGLERAEEAGLSAKARIQVARRTVVEGTREVTFPILATTMTTIVAFISFIFLSGRLALYYVPLAVSVATAMLASLFVAFGWLPVVLNQTWAQSVAKRKTGLDKVGTDPESIESYVEDTADYLSEKPGWFDRVIMGTQRAWWIVLPPVLALVLWAGIPPLPETWKYPVFGLGEATAADSADVAAAADSLSEASPPSAGPVQFARALFSRGVSVTTDSVEVAKAIEEKASWLPYDKVGEVYGDKVLKGGFWRFPDAQELFLYLEMPAGTDIAVTSETLARFEDSITPIPEGARMQATTIDNRAFIRVTFEDDKVLETNFPIQSRYALEEQADVTGGSSIFIRGFSDSPYFKGPFSGSALNSLVKISGYNSRKLNEIADEALKRMSRNRRVRNPRITSGARFDRAFLEETLINIDRDKLVEHNLSVMEVVGYLRRLLGVDSPWTMLLSGEEERVQLAFHDSETIQYSDIAGKTLAAPNGDQVRLGDLVQLETVPVKGSVIRENQRYTVSLSWEYVGTDKMRRAYIKQTLAGLELPYGYSAEEGQQEFFTRQEEEELSMMAFLAAAFILMVLAALFESASLPLLVLTALPMALVGVFIIFWKTDSTFDSSARIGLILLFGIVVNNAILLVSRFRTEASLIIKARRGGDPESEAALFPGMRKQMGGSDLWILPDDEDRSALLRRAVARGTKIRLRSILLTSGTTVVGLLPLLIQFRDSGDGQDIWENLALSSIGGLVSSTILIVLAIPPLYYASIQCNWMVRRVGGRLLRLVRRQDRKPIVVTNPAKV